MEHEGEEVDYLQESAFSNMEDVEMEVGDEKGAEGDEDEIEDEEEEYAFRFEEGMNPLSFAENNASGVQLYQHFERLEYEALAEKKRKAVSGSKSESSAKMARLEDLSGASMEEIMELMNLSARRKSRKSKKKGRRRGTRKKLNSDLTGMLGDATLHYAHGRYEDAISVLHEVVRQAPNISDPYHTLALVHSAIGDEKKAMAFYMLAAHLTSNDPSLWKLLFTWSIEKGDTGQAMYCISKAITSAPKDSSLRLHRASLYFELGDNVKAAESYEQISQLCPENVEALKTAAKLYLKGSQVQRSINILEEYIKVHPTEADLSLIDMLASILMANNEHKKALELIEHACSAGELPLNLTIKAAICHAHLRNMEKSEILLSVLQPECAHDNADLIMEVAETFMNLQHFRSALKYYFMLEGNSRGNPVKGSVYLKIAYCYSSMLENSEAISFFYKALLQLEDNIDARLTLVALLLEEAKEDEAILLLSPPKYSDSKIDQNGVTAGSWWLNERVKLKLSQIYRAKGMLEEFVGCVFPLVQQSLEERFQHPKGRRRGRRSNAIWESAKLLDDRQTDSVLHPFKQIAPQSEMIKVSRAKKQLEKKAALKEKRKADAEAAGIKWPSDDSDYEFPEPHQEEIKNSPLRSLLKDEEYLCLIIDLCEVLTSLKRDDEALEIIYQTLILNDDILSVEKKEELQSLGIQISYKTGDPNYGFGCVRALVRQHPNSLAAWNCYYKVITRLEDQKTKHSRLLHNMRKEHNGLIPPIILAGNQFTMKSKHQDAARAYLEAFKKDQESPLINLCVGTALINVALGHRLKTKHQCVAQGLAFLYNNLRLCGTSQEALYNIARACHHVGLVSLAASYYEKVLETPIPVLSNENPDQYKNLEMGYCDLRREAAYNLHLIYKKSGAIDLARQLLKDYCTF